MDISILIITHNTKYYLRQCLLSVLKQKIELKHEIFVIDNGSFDGTYEMVKKDFPYVKIIRNQVSKGFSHGVNTGLRSCNGRNIFILEADTELTKENDVQLLSNILDENHDVGIVGPQLILVKENKIQNSAFIKFPSISTFLMEWSQLNILLGKLFPRLDYPGKYYYSILQLQKDMNVAWLMGGIIMIKRNVINKAGMMDEGYFLLWEDTDWLKRISDYGFKIRYCTDIKIRHHWGVNQSDEKKTIKNYYEGMKRYLKKNMSENQIFYIFLITYICSVINCIILSMAYMAGGKKRLKISRMLKFYLHWLLLNLPNRLDEKNANSTNNNKL
jgi:GT2 family glycosyltransferase